MTIGQVIIVNQSNFHKISNALGNEIVEKSSHFIH